MIYSLKALLDKNPVQIAGAAMTILNVPILAGWVHLTAVTVAALNPALVALLGLFVVSRTVNAASLTELDDATTPKR